MFIWNKNTQTRSYIEFQRNKITYTECHSSHSDTHTSESSNQRVCRTQSHIIPWDNASSKCFHPSLFIPPPLPLPYPPPLISTHPPLSLPFSRLPVILHSACQQCRPANPLWKETTEQKITSPPLSHTPSLAFVFSSGLLLTTPSPPPQHHHQLGVSRPPLSFIHPNYSPFSFCPVLHL